MLVGLVFLTAVKSKIMLYSEVTVGDWWPTGFNDGNISTPAVSGQHFGFGQFIFIFSDRSLCPQGAIVFKHQTNDQYVPESV